MTDDLCQCPTCGRMHRHLGTPPKSVMEQIARDIREGTFPKKSERTLQEASLANFNAIIAALNYDGPDENSLTVGEIRRALQ